MDFLDRLKLAGRQARRGADNLAVYARHLLEGNRAPHVSATAVSQCVASESGSRVPVLLLQGYFANRGSVQLLARRLYDRGYVVFTYRLGGLNTGDIRDTAAHIARKVESIVEQTGLQQVDIAGHSMGGLVGLFYVKQLDRKRRVRTLVLLGSPVGGTWSALLGFFAEPFGAARQLLPTSTFLRVLKEGPLPEGVRLFTITGQNDWFAPVRMALLPGAQNIILPTTHSGLLVEEATADALDRVLSGRSREDIRTTGFVDDPGTSP
ncbi:MAG: alpha/beta fold hydrolase [Deltaproteobacteria bacterium]|nr:alpha/beta fold hydrolase [Deltaproteobacteria bacterium]